MRSVPFWLLVAVAGLACVAGCVKPPAAIPVAQQDAPSSPPVSPPPEPPMENLEVAEPAPAVAAEVQNTGVVEEPAIQPPAETPQTAAPAQAEPVVVERPAPTPKTPARHASRSSASSRSGRTSSERSHRDDGPRSTTKSAALRDLESKPWGTGGKYPWASQVRITPEMMKSMSNEELSKAAMEIKARRGASFDDPAWQKYFDRQDWYYKGQMYGGGRLSETEARNLEAIRTYQQQQYGRPWKPSE